MDNSKYPTPDFSTFNPEVFNIDRLQQDYKLTQDIQDGYNPPIVSSGTKHRIIDGNLKTDAAKSALSEIWHQYRPAAVGLSRKYGARIASIPTISQDDLINQGFFGVYHAAVVWHP